MSGAGKFDPDIFISCAAADDQKHWITSFEEELQAHLNKLLGRKVAIWRDTTVNNSCELSRKVSKKLSNAAVLLCILSHNWRLGARPDVAEFQQGAISKGRTPTVITVYKKAIVFRPDLLPEWRVEWKFFGKHPEYREFSPKDQEFHAAIAALALKIALVLSSEKLLVEGLSQPSGTFDIVFSPELSDYEIRKAFAALADYYRACGGIGLAIEHELEQVPARESVNV